MIIMAKEIRPENANRFHQLAEKRVIKAIKAIRLVGNLSNRTNYSYTDEEARKIVSALQEEISTVKKRFSEPGSSGEVTFKL